MKSLFNSFAFLCLLHSIVGQFSIGGQQSSQQTSSQSSQYPRIKIGGPLGQLIPNGFQLGAGLGSVINQLIGQSAQDQSSSSSGAQQSGGQSGGQMSAQANSPFAALRAPFGQQFALNSALYPSSSGSGQQQPSLPYSSLYSSGKYSSSAYNPNVNPSANLFSNFNSDSGVYGSASSPPLMGHSSQLGSTNSDLFSHSFNSQQNFD